MKNTAWYRADIDGLRAIAVLGVIFYHFGIFGFKGGFVGVDVFFVISGFLITTILVRDFEAGTFSLGRFWERRVRRILPALFLVLIVTTGSALYIISYPPDIESYGQSVLAQSIFLANIYFLRQGDYFGAASETQPLLHTWSLSVEEQFYIVFPLLLMLVMFFRNYLSFRMVVIVVMISSFVYSTYLSLVVPNHYFSIVGLPDFWSGSINLRAAFFVPMTRAWELCAGALLAVTITTVCRRLFAESIALVGLTLIVLGMFLIDPSSRFPGVVALVPVIGTVAVIWANYNHSTAVSRMLSYFPLVGVGVISYSLYLWHWPIYSLASYVVEFTSFTAMQIFALLALTFSFSYVTYYLVERPSRHLFREATSWHVVIIGCLGLLAFAAVGYVITKQLVIPDDIGYASRYLEVSGATEETFNCTQVELSDGVLGCLLGIERAQDTSFAVIGDSHAIGFLPALSAEAKRRGYSGMAIIEASCLPLPLTRDSNAKESCVKARLAAQQIFADNRYKSVVVIGRWELYADLEVPAEYISAEDYFSKLVDALVLSSTQNKKIFFLQQVPPQPAFDIRTAYSRQVRFPNKLIDISNLEPFTNDFEKDSGFERAVFRSVETSPLVELIDPAQVLCQRQGTCALVKDNQVLYQDDNHLSVYGVGQVVPLFEPFFKSLE